MNVLLLTERSVDRMLFNEVLATLPSVHKFTTFESVAQVGRALEAPATLNANLIFLDAELSKDSDHELVEAIKNAPNLKAAPIVVYADAVKPEEITVAYGLNVACYVVFPPELCPRKEKIRACLTFWNTYAQLPELRRWWIKEKL
jgi:CheY-like chemotaxis protein